MIAFVVLGVFVALFLAVGWARMASARAERRSVETHERILGVLGGVAKRSEASAPIHAPSGEDVARPHVHHPAVSPVHELQPTMFPGLLGQPERTFASSPALRPSPQFDSLAPEADESEDQSELPVVALSFSDLDPAEDASVVVSTKRRALFAAAHHHPRRAATGAVAAVALGGLAIGGWQLAASQIGHGTPLPTTNQGLHDRSGTTPGAGHLGQGQATALQPTYTSSSTVAFSVPSEIYTLTFLSSNRCWVGVTTTTNPAGPYLSQQTVASGDTWSYQASGTVVVRIGAPDGLIVDVNGEALKLPAGRLNPYDLDLTPIPSASA